jgi:hypothetical protein
MLAHHFPANLKVCPTRTNDSSLAPLCDDGA